MGRIAFVTTCKNRLDHLRRTLPTWMAEDPDEIIVVDYGCPQGSGDWVRAHWPQVRVVRVDDDSGFCLSRARNLGAREVTADWICFIDADIVVREGWVTWMRRHLAEGHYYRPARGMTSVSGTAIVPRRAFERVEGYDEHFRGWGGEDTDLYHRMRLAGWRAVRYPAHYVSPIPHDDAERFEYMAARDPLAQIVTNALYLDGKRLALSLGVAVGELPQAWRAQWRADVMRAVEAWSGDAQAPLPSIVRVLDQFHWLPDDWRGRVRCRLAVSVQRQSKTKSGWQRLRRAWGRFRARVRGLPGGALDAIGPGVRDRVRPYVEGVRRLPAGGLELRLRGHGARLPEPYRVHVDCHVTVLP